MLVEVKEYIKKSVAVGKKQSSGVLSEALCGKEVSVIITSEVIKRPKSH